jgi:hypothetical protein
MYINMLHFYKKFTATFLIALFLMVAAFPAISSAQLFKGSLGDACSAVGAGDASGDCNRTDLENSSSSLSTTLTNIVNVLSVIIGVGAVIMLIISGLRYVTSAGDSGQITSAKHTFIYALVGLIIVALAQSLVKFVINRVA